VKAAAFPVAVTVAVTVKATETVTVAVPSAPQETGAVLKGVPAPAVPAPEFVPVPKLLPLAAAGAPGYDIPDDNGL